MDGQYKVYIANTAKISFDRRAALFRIKIGNSPLFVSADTMTECQVVIAGQWIQALVPVVGIHWVEACISRQQYVPTSGYELLKVGNQPSSSERAALRSNQNSLAKIPSTQFGQSTEGSLSQEASQSRLMSPHSESQRKVQDSNRSTFEKEQKIVPFHLPPSSTSSSATYFPQNSVIDLTDLDTAPQTPTRASNSGIHKTQSSGARVPIKKADSLSQSPTPNLVRPIVPPTPVVVAKPTAAPSKPSILPSDLIERSSDSESSSSHGEDDNRADIENETRTPKIHHSTSSFSSGTPLTQMDPSTMNYSVNSDELEEVQRYKKQKERPQIQRPSLVPVIPSHRITSHQKSKSSIHPPGAPNICMIREDTSSLEPEYESSFSSSNSPPPFSPSSESDEDFELTSNSEEMDEEKALVAKLMGKNRWKQEFSAANHALSHSSRKYDASRANSTQKSSSSRQARRQRETKDPGKSTTPRSRSSRYDTSEGEVDNDFEKVSVPERRQRSRKKRKSIPDEDYRPQKGSGSVISSSKKRQHHQLEEDIYHGSDVDERRQTPNHFLPPVEESVLPQLSPPPAKRVSKTNIESMEPLNFQYPSEVTHNGGFSVSPSKAAAPNDPIKIYLCGVKGREYLFEKEEVSRIESERVILVPQVMQATHVVLSDDPQRTMSVLRAIACGKWVLRYKWYSTLMRLQSIPNEIDFEFERWPGVRFARLAHKMQFQQQQQYLHMTNSELTPNQDSPFNHSLPQSKLLFDSKSFNVQKLPDSARSLLVDVFGATGATIDTKNSSIQIVPDEEWDFNTVHTTWHMNGHGTMPLSYIIDCIQLWNRMNITDWHEYRKISQP